jgi:hypothetical protein
MQPNLVQSFAAVEISAKAAMLQRGHSSREISGRFTALGNIPLLERAG